MFRFSVLRRAHLKISAAIPPPFKNEGYWPPASRLTALSLADFFRIYSPHFQTETEILRGALESYLTLTSIILLVSIPKISTTLTITLYRPAALYSWAMLVNSSVGFFLVRKLCHSFSNK